MLVIGFVTSSVGMFALVNARTFVIEVTVLDTLHLGKIHVAGMCEVAVPFLVVVTSATASESVVADACFSDVHGRMGKLARLAIGAVDVGAEQSILREILRMGMKTCSIGAVSALPVFGEDAAMFCENLAQSSTLDDGVNVSRYLAQMEISAIGSRACNLQGFRIMIVAKFDRIRVIVVMSHVNAMGKSKCC